MNLSFWLLAGCGAILALWYAWPALPTLRRSAPAEPAPAASHGPTATESIEALLVLRRRLEAVGADPERVQQLLEFAPQLLAGDG